MSGQNIPGCRIIGITIMFLLQSCLITSNRGLLCRAASRGDVKSIKKLLLSGCDIHSSDGSRFTPLHEAARAGHVDAAGLLIACGARVDAKSQNDYSTPLHQAAEHSHTKVLQLLLKHGANVNAVRDEKIYQHPYHRCHTALYYAVSRGPCTAAVQMLLRAGATVYETDDDQEHLLFDAVGHDNRTIVQLLLDHGVEVNIAKRRNGCFQGQTPLHWARKRSMAELLLRAGADISAKDKDGEEALHFVSLLGISPALIDFLIESGADVHGKNNKGQTALHRAAKNVEGASILQALLIHGADVGVQDCRGDTPLHLAAEASWYPGESEKKYLPNVQVLLCAGADPDVRNTSGQTPLHKAWHVGHTAIFKELVARGAEFLSREAVEFVSAGGNGVGMVFYLKCRALARERYQAIALFLEHLIDTEGIPEDVITGCVIPWMLSDTQLEQLKQVKHSWEVMWYLLHCLKFAKSLFA